MCQPWSVTKTPVCVLGLGLIGGSLMRAAKAAGREVFGYNRSVDGVEAARFDGFDATTDLADVAGRGPPTRRADRARRADARAAAHARHVRDDRPDCPLTDVTSVKGAVLAEVERAGLLDRFVGGHPMTGTAHSGWAAGDAGLFVERPGCSASTTTSTREVWATVMHLALDCGAFVVPARSDEHDAAAAAISHLPHLLAEALAVTAGDVPLAFALAAGSFRDGTRVAATAPDLVRAMCEANSDAAATRARPGHRPARRRPRSAGPARAASPNSSRPATPPGSATTASSRPEIVATVDRRGRTGATNWPPRVARAG